MGVAKKKCATCNTINRTGLHTPHDCNINSEGSSGAMESEVALRLAIGIYRKWGGMVYIKFIVSDDDSTMRAYLQHRCNNDKGKLPDDIPEPTFLADPSH